jgi:hypothetical protein
LRAQVREHRRVDGPLLEVDPLLEVLCRDEGIERFLLGPLPV